MSSYSEMPGAFIYLLHVIQAPSWGFPRGVCLTACLFSLSAAPQISSRRAPAFGTVDILILASHTTSKAVSIKKRLFVRCLYTPALPVIKGASPARNSAARPGSRFPRSWEDGVGAAGQEYCSSLHPRRRLTPGAAAMPDRVCPVRAAQSDACWERLAFESGEPGVGMPGRNRLKSAQENSAAH